MLDGWLNAALLGLLAASSLIVGALVAFARPISDRTLGLVLAFGAGVLMSAVAYELVAEALHGGTWEALYAVAFAAGAIVFWAGSRWLDGRADSNADGKTDASGEGSAIVLGAVLDGVPESVVLGVSLLGGGSVSIPMLLAVFISNVPEALGASAELVAGGQQPRRVLLMWVLVALASAAAAGVGYLVFSRLDAVWVSGAQMFAGGAIIAMLAESMVPEASRKGGRAVGLATALGFAVAAILSAAT
ncbi:MAG: ZIP family zinc transporter [Chloroflexota bacterium]